MPHALGKAGRQRSRMLAAFPLALEESRELLLHCRPHHREHQQSTSRVILVAKEEDLRGPAQTFAVEELADRRSNIEPGCVNAQHLDPSDCDSSCAYDVVVSKEHVSTPYSDQY